MIYRILYLCLFLFLFLFGENTYSQTTVNPDISAVGDIQLFTHNDSTRHDESDKLNFSDPEIELNISGYLNPYSRADIVLSWAGDNTPEIEEGYATILRGLPFNVNLKLGKYLLEFGRLNATHPHAYLFIKRPLVHETFFGDEGLSDMAVRASFAIPTGGAFSEIMGGIIKGDALAQEDEVELDIETSEPKRNDIGFIGRVATSIATSEFSELAIGTSLLNSVYAFSEDSTQPFKQLRSTMIGGDIKYKYKPSKYTSVQIEAEFIARRNEQESNSKSLKSYGSYSYINYRFQQKYNIGAMFDWVKLNEIDDKNNPNIIDETITKRIGLFTGFAPLEESSLIRLASFYIIPDVGEKYFETTLQFVFSLGPHKPHSF